MEVAACSACQPYPTTAGNTVEPFVYSLVLLQCFLAAAFGFATRLPTHCAPGSRVLLEAVCFCKTTASARQLPQDSFCKRLKGGGGSSRGCG